MCVCVCMYVRAYTWIFNLFFVFSSTPHGENSRLNSVFINTLSAPSTLSKCINPTWNKMLSSIHFCSWSVADKGFRWTIVLEYVLLPSVEFSIQVSFAWRSSILDRLVNSKLNGIAFIWYVILWYNTMKTISDIDLSKQGILLAALIQNNPLM